MPIVTGTARNHYEHIFEVEVLDADPRAPCFNQFWSEVTVGYTAQEIVRETVRYENTAPFGLPREETFSVDRGSKPIMERRRMPDPITFRPMCGQHFHGRRDVFDSNLGHHGTHERATCFKCIRIFVKTYFPEEAN